MPTTAATPEDLSPLQTQITDLESRVADLKEDVQAETNEVVRLRERVTALEARPQGGGIDVSRMGIRTLDDFAGATDADKLLAGLNAQAQVSGPKWTLVLPNRAFRVDWNRARFPGMRLSGPLGGYEREFSGGGREQCIIIVGNPNGLFSVPATVGQGSEIGIQYRAAGSTVRYETANTNLTSGPILTDHVWSGCSWNGFRGVMTQRHTRCMIEKFYNQAGSGDQYVLAGSDNFYGGAGNNYTDSQVMPATGYYFRFVHMSRTRFENTYITPDFGTAVSLEGSFGDFHLISIKFDLTNRAADRARNPAVVITNGHGYTFSNCWFFNLAANPARAGEKGNVWINGGSDQTFNACTWAGGSGTGSALAAGASLVPIYTNNGARVAVVAPTFIGGMPAKLQYRTGLTDPYLRPLRSDITVEAA